MGKLLPLIYFAFFTYRLAVVAAAAAVAVVVRHHQQPRAPPTLDSSAQLGLVAAAAALLRQQLRPRRAASVGADLGAGLRQELQRGLASLLLLEEGRGKNVLF